MATGERGDPSTEAALERMLMAVAALVAAALLVMVARRGR